MASSKGGLRFVEASKAPSGVDASTTSEFEAAVEVEAAVEAKQATDRFGNPRIRTEKVDNVMGSQAGAGSGDFHMYRHHRRTEMLRVERMEGQAAVDEAEESPTQYVSLNWLLNEAPMAPVEELSWDVLNHLLLGTAAAELEKPLIASGLGAATIGGGYDGHLQQATFSVGLKGVALGDEAVAGVEGCVLDTLRGLADGGFDEEAVRASTRRPHPPTPPLDPLARTH